MAYFATLGKYMPWRVGTIMPNRRDECSPWSRFPLSKVIFVDQIARHEVPNKWADVAVSAVLIASAVTEYVPDGMPVSVTLTRSERSCRSSFNLVDRIFFFHSIAPSLLLSFDVNETIPHDDSPKWRYRQKNHVARMLFVHWTQLNSGNISQMLERMYCKRVPHLCQMKLSFIRLRYKDTLPRTEIKRQILSVTLVFWYANLRRTLYAVATLLLSKNLYRIRSYFIGASNNRGSPWTFMRRDSTPRETISGTGVAVDIGQLRSVECCRNLNTRCQETVTLFMVSGWALGYIYEGVYTRNIEAHGEQEGNETKRSRRETIKERKRERVRETASRGASSAWVENSPWPGRACRDRPLCTCHSIFIPL